MQPTVSTSGEPLSLDGAHHTCTLAAATHASSADILICWFEHTSQDRRFGASCLAQLEDVGQGVSMSRTIHFALGMCLPCLLTTCKPDAQPPETIHTRKDKHGPLRLRMPDASAAQPSHFCAIARLHAGVLSVGIWPGLSGIVRLLHCAALPQIQPHIIIGHSHVLYKHLPRLDVTTTSLARACTSSCIGMQAGTGQQLLLEMVAVLGAVLLALDW